VGPKGGRAFHEYDGNGATPNTNPWEIFKNFLLKIRWFFFQEGWSLQLRELNCSTAPEKLQLREKPFPSPGELSSTQNHVPSSQAACRKHSSGYKDWNV